SGFSSVDANHKSRYRLLVLFFCFVLIQLKLTGDNTLNRVLGNLNRISITAWKKSKTLNIKLPEITSGGPGNNKKNRRSVFFTLAHPYQKQSGRLYFALAGESDQRRFTAFSLKFARLIDRGQDSTGNAIEVLQYAAGRFVTLKDGHGQCLDVCFSKISVYC